MLSKAMYDKLKFLAQIGLPALGTFYFALAQIWGIPGGEEMVGTIMAIDAFLGVLLGLSTKAYNNSDAKFDGQIKVYDEPDRDKKTFSLELKTHPDELETKKEVIFKVDPV